jgi:hypothetical protein
MAEPTIGKKRIEWTGDTSKVAFLFYDDWRDDWAIDSQGGEFEVYQKYEKKHPGAIDALESHYGENEEAWKSNEIKLTAEQIEQLEVLIECVNLWFTQETNLFLAMNALFYTNLRITEWDPADNAGMTKFCEDVDWWREDSNLTILESDILESIKFYLGEESYLFTRLCDYSRDELLEYFHDFWAGWFDLEVFLENRGDEISDDEREEIVKFLTSEILLKEFRYSSRRYHSHKNS